MIRLAPLAVFVLALPGASSAQDRLVWQSKTSGSILMNLCPVDRKSGVYDPCGALLVGLIDGLSAGGVYCPPDNFTITQGEQVILAHVRAAPEKWHQPAGLLAWQALARAFPCPTG